LGKHEREYQTSGNGGLKELNQHKPCFDKEYLRFLDPRKQAKM
jgi:hypothetical protein